MKNIMLALAATAAVIAVAQLDTVRLLAHHSHAMFDGSKETEITGTLTNARFSNPHVYLRVEATERDGTKLTPPQVWAIEMSTVANMQQRGITPDLLKVGMPISIKVNPLFSGGFSGNYTTLVMLNNVKNTSTDQDWKPAVAAAR
jgi:hypothetical protein